MTSHTSFLSRNEPYISCQTDPAKKKNFSLTHFSQVFVTSPSMQILESGNKQRKGLIISFITHYNMWCSSNENTKKNTCLFTFSFIFLLSAISNRIELGFSEQTMMRGTICSAYNVIDICDPRCDIGLISVLFYCFTFMTLLFTCQ